MAAEAGLYTAKAVLLVLPLAAIVDPILAA